MGAALVTVSFALMFLLPALPPHGQLILIAISAVGFDLGLQSSLVAHQNLVYGLEPQARDASTRCCSPACLLGCRWVQYWEANCMCSQAGAAW
ncbi:MFS permease protein [Klebsiella michiganensis]|nr:MFS permease protein [Klebsiella michiganensis]